MEQPESKFVPTGESVGIFVGSTVGLSVGLRVGRSLSDFGSGSNTVYFIFVSQH